MRLAKSSLTLAMTSVYGTCIMIDTTQDESKKKKGIQRNANTEKGSILEEVREQAPLDRGFVWRHANLAECEENREKRDIASP